METSNLLLCHKDQENRIIVCWNPTGTHFQALLEYLFILIMLFRKHLFIYFWLRWVFLAACRLSLVVASRVYSADTVVVARGLSFSTACGAQTRARTRVPSLCPLHWQADS